MQPKSLNEGLGAYKKYSQEIPTSELHYFRQINDYNTNIYFNDWFSPYEIFDMLSIRLISYRVYFHTQTSMKHALFNVISVHN